jgi:hypothetical protein
VRPRDEFFFLAAVRDKNVEKFLSPPLMGSDIDPDKHEIICSLFNDAANNSRILTYGAEPFLRSLQLCSYSRYSQHFMEPGDSLSCSQEPFTGPYPEPSRSNAHHPILFL